MSPKKTNKWVTNTRLLLGTLLALFLAAAVRAATPGISGGTGPAVTFKLTASTAFLNQPDGAAVYSWGYGCSSGFSPTFLPSAIDTGDVGCPTMQVPGPTLIVTEGQMVTVILTNGLPNAAGNTSILFPGFQVTTSGGTPGLLTQEAAPGGTVTYTFMANSPGTHAYYSGTQGDLQIEMGLYGAVVVLPNNVPAKCTTGLAAQNRAAQNHWNETDFRLSQAAFDHDKTCYDREYLFQWGEMDPSIHAAALAQVTAKVNCVVTDPACHLQVPTEPYHPTYYLINGRSMPDLMDPNYAPEYPHQPYNADPHLHPGEQVLIRSIGQGRWQHPFHEHGNHVRILARDGNLILSQGNSDDLAGPLMFNTDTTPGDAFDGIFYWTGRGLNWDPYGHHQLPAGGDAYNDPLGELPCNPDANGYNTGFNPSDTSFSGTPDPSAANAVNYYEWCQDHNKPVEVAPFGDVGSGGPATLPDPNIFTNGAWYSGSPYLGPDATLRAVAPDCATTANITSLTCSSQQPANTQANPSNERGYAFMWHSHNEREITTNNVFPGGMLMMMLVDSREFVIDESK